MTRKTPVPRLSSTANVLNRRDQYSARTRQAGATRIGTGKAGGARSESGRSPPAGGMTTSAATRRGSAAEITARRKHSTAARLRIMEGPGAMICRCSNTSGPSPRRTAKDHRFQAMELRCPLVELSFQSNTAMTDRGVVSFDDAGLLPVIHALRTPYLGRTKKARAVPDKRPCNGAEIANKPGHNG